MRYKNTGLLINGSSRKHHATVYNVSNVYISRRRHIDYRSSQHSPAYIRHVAVDEPGDIIPVPPPARSKKTAAPRGFVRVGSRGLERERENRTVINNRFLPAPVCAASTQGEIFSSRLARGRQGGDGGENVGHKNVPVRNGPGEERARRVCLFAGDRTFGIFGVSVRSMYRGCTSYPSSRLSRCALRRREGKYGSSRPGELRSTEKTIVPPGLEEPGG